MRKICNNCGFQQDEFLNLGGRNYCNSCNSEINNNSNTIQSSITLSAYEKKVAQDTFFLTMEVLEKYVEKANYYPDWQTRRKIGDNKVTREFGSLEEVESVLSSSLLGFKAVLRNKPPFLFDELREEYYKWINATGIDINNIVPQAERLKHWLYEVNEILEGRGERFAEEVAQESRRHVGKMSNEEFSRKMNEAFGVLNVPLNKERERAKSLEGKTYKDVSSDSKFAGADSEKGRQVFNRISSVVAGGHEKFDYYQKQNNQQRTNSEIIQDVKQNPQNWRIDEIHTEIGYSGTKQEKVLIHQSVRLDNYDQQGKLNFNGNPIYRADRFSSQEISEIDQALNISQTSTPTPYYQKSVSEKVGIPKTPNSNDSNLGTMVIVSSILLVASLGIYGIIKKSKKIKK